MKSHLTAFLVILAGACGLLAGELSITVTEHQHERKPEKIAEFSAADEQTRSEMLALWEKARKDIAKDHRMMFGPDSGYISIKLINGKDEIHLASWHPLYEANPKLVVTSHGVTALDGRKREDVLKADKAWYQDMRRIFDEILSYAKSRGPVGK